jgi:hypothetical protein
MEEKSSFYEFLAANSKLKEDKQETPKRSYLLISFLIILLVNSLTILFFWNFVISEIFDIRELSFFQACLTYLGLKSIARGFFKPE